MRLPPLLHRLWHEIWPCSYKFIATFALCLSCGHGFCPTTIFMNPSGSLGSSTGHGPECETVPMVPNLQAAQNSSYGQSGIALEIDSPFFQCPMKSIFLPITPIPPPAPGPSLKSNGKFVHDNVADVPYEYWKSHCENGGVGGESDSEYALNSFTFHPDQTRNVFILSAKYVASMSPSLYRTDASHFGLFFRYAINASQFHWKARPSWAASRSSFFLRSSSTFNESWAFVVLIEATSAFSVSTSFSSLDPSLIECPTLKSSIVTPRTTEAIKRDSSLWCSSFSCFLRPAGWWCNHHSPVHPIATSNPDTSSKKTQNQKGGINNHEAKIRLIVATIPEIIFGMLLLFVICM